MHQNTKICGGAALIALGIFLQGCTNSGALVQTQDGSIQGIARDDVHIFRGIPYAAPPVGALRWAAPQPVEPWRETLQANAWGPSCWQDISEGNSVFIESTLRGSGMSEVAIWLGSFLSDDDEAQLSEDCLRLHVITPNLAPDQPLPVMLWIHGGGHQYGSGGGVYESASLAKKGVVLVSINYRLGLFGFLAHPELAKEDPFGSTGNYGTLDQIAALRWIQSNIRAFGGDPDNVTIFGESAGGHSVGQLMASPLTQGLIHRAIAQSGTGFYQFQTTDRSFENISGYQAGRLAAQKLGLAGEDEISQMRTLSIDQLKAIVSDRAISATFHPQVDGYVLTQPTSNAFEASAQAKIPLMVGSNADEGSVLYRFGLSPVDGLWVQQPNTERAWQALLEEAFEEQAEAIANHYIVDADRDVIRAGEQLMGDSWFGRHAYYMAERHAAAGQPAYLYFFERRSPSARETNGAGHALELFPLFGSSIPFWPRDGRDDELSEQMQVSWTNFARRGDPNGSGAPAWPVFTPQTPREMALGHERSYPRPVERRNRYDAMRGQMQKRETAYWVTDN